MHRVACRCWYEILEKAFVPTKITFSTVSSLDFLFIKQRTQRDDYFLTRTDCSLLRTDFSCGEREAASFLDKTMIISLFPFHHTQTNFLCVRSCALVRMRAIFCCMCQAEVDKLRQKIDILSRNEMHLQSILSSERSFRVHDWGCIKAEVRPFVTLFYPFI